MWSQYIEGESRGGRKKQNVKLGERNRMWIQYVKEKVELRERNRMWSQYGKEKVEAEEGNRM